MTPTNGRNRKGGREAYGASLKTGEVKASVGSNPTPSANIVRNLNDRIKRLL